MAGDRATRTGSCLCGAVRYRAAGPMRQVVGCHCSQCRKQTGHYLAATDVHKDALEITEDRGLRWYAASDVARRGFCAECGSFLFWQANGGDWTSIAAGTLDRPTGLRLVAHIFVDDKGDYYELDDGLPQHAKGGANVSRVD